jgi:hypothetical protein
MSGSKTLVAAAILVLASCDATDPAGTTRLSVLLTDDPGDFAQAVVTIERIELSGSGGLVLRDEPWTGDLLTLANEVVDLVRDEVVEEGTYSQLRFVIPEACIAVKGAAPPQIDVFSTGPDFASHCDEGTLAGVLQLPSFAQTGIKVKAPFTVEGEQKVLLVDFDVSESFGRLAGGSGQWVMHPVIHTAEIGLSASITVAVVLGDGVSLPDGVSLTDFAATLDDTEGLGLDDEGKATFAYLVPSDSPFLIGLTPPDGVTIATDPALPVSVSVDSGASVSVEITITRISS